MRLTQLGLVVVLALLSQGARGDGIYFPSPGYRGGFPRIPNQTALIVHRDGIETLIVESTVDAAGGGNAYGWIIPLPAEPTSIEKASPDLLESARRLIKPLIPRGPAVGVLLLILCPVVVLVGYWWSRPFKTTGGLFLRFIGTIFIIGFPIVIAVPGFIHARGVSVPTPEVAVLHQSRVGNYDVSVLRGNNGTAVQDWLKTHGLIAPNAAAQAVLGVYVREGWCFVAAKLAADSTGPLTPHPLRLTFPTKEPIYPMRLTGLSGGSVDVNLFMISGKQRDPAGMDVILRQQIESAGAGSASSSERAIRIAYPPLGDLMQTGDWVMRLERKFESGEMNEDIRFHEANPLAEPIHRGVYSSGEAIAAALAYALPAGYGIFLLIAMFYRPSEKRWRIGVLAASAAIAATAGLGFKAWKGLIIRETSPHGSQTFPVDRNRYILRGFDHFVRDIAKGAHLEDYAAHSDEQLTRAVAEYVTGKYFNSVTGEKIEKRAAPGDFQIELERSDGPILVLYDAWDGYPNKMNLRKVALHAGDDDWLTSETLRRRRP